MSILRDFISSQVPLIWVHSLEEGRFIDEEHAALLPTKFQNKMYVYDASNVIYDVERAVVNKKNQEIEVDSATAAIANFTQETEHKFEDYTSDEACVWDITQFGFPEKSIMIMLDVPFQMVDPTKVKHTNARLTRAIKEAIPKLIRQKKTLVIVNHHKDVPVELEYVVTFVEHKIPNIKKLRNLVKGARKTIKEAPEIILTDDELDKTAHLLKGLTLWQAENVLAIANRANAIEFKRKEVGTRSFKSEVIRNEKSRLIQKSSTLKIIEPSFGLNEVGGMNKLKEWAQDRIMIFGPEAREEGIDIPKGILTVGPGGVGKSYVAQALGKAWDRQILRLDIAACMGKYLGDSEGALLKALEDAGAQEPCILFVDEFEKLFSGASGSSGRTDSGTFGRMYGTWLTWTQSRKEDVFVVATTNDITNLPAPALRKGRFDEIFYIHLPSTNERKDIFDIHLRKRGWAPDQFGIDLEVLAEKTPKRTGSEIEQIVIESLIRKVKDVGYGKEKPITTKHILDSIGSIKTMNELNPQEADNLFEWAKARGVMMASDEYIQEENKTKGIKPRSKDGKPDQGGRSISIDESEV